jgi:hypothetical protein
MCGGNYVCNYWGLDVTLQICEIFMNLRRKYYAGTYTGGWNGEEA